MYRLESSFGINIGITQKNPIKNLY